MYLLYITLGIAIGTYELCRPRTRPFDWLSILTCSFIGFYIVPPVFLHLDPEVFGSKIAEHGLSEGLSSSVFLYVLFAYVVCAAVYKFADNITEKHVRIDFHQRFHSKYDLYFAISLLLTGAASQWSYAQTVGGYIATISCAEALRGGLVDGGYGYARMLLPGAFFGLITLLGYRDRAGGSIQITLLIVFASILTLSSLALLSGRSVLLAPAITLWLYFAIKDRRIVWTFPVLVLLIVVIMGLWKSVSIAIPCTAYQHTSAVSFQSRLQEQMELRLAAQIRIREEFESRSGNMPPPADDRIDITQLIEESRVFLTSSTPEWTRDVARIYNTEFDHRIVSLNEAIKSTAHEEFEFHWFSDAARFLWKMIIPERITGEIQYFSVERMNKYLLAQDSDLGFIPPGFLAYGIYSGGLTGLTLMLIVYAATGAALARSIQASILQHPDFMVTYAAIGWFWGFTLHYGSPETIVSHGLLLPVYALYQLGFKYRWSISRRGPH